MKSFSVFLVFLFLTVAYGQVIDSGKCPVVHGIQNFDRIRFTEKWFQLRRLPSDTELDTKCNALEFTFGDGNNNSVHVNYTYIAADGVPHKLLGSGTVGDNIGSINVLFDDESTAFPDFNEYIEYVFTGTDYDNWVTIFACKYYAENDTHQLYLWILTRSLNPSSKVLNDAISSAHSQHISTELMELVVHQNC